MARKAILKLLKMDFLDVSILSTEYEVFLHDRPCVQIPYLTSILE